MNFVSIFALVFLLFLAYLVSNTDEAYTRNGAILNINWIYSLPWDVANTLRTPLGGPLALILTSCLAIVLFFGMIVSPVYYLLGTPPRKYHIHDAIVNRLTIADRDLQRVFPANSSMELLKALKLGSSELPANFSVGNETFSTMGSNITEGINLDYFKPEATKDPFPDFLQNFFWLVGEDDVNCKKLMVCHAHGFFNYLPDWTFRYYRIFSSRMISIPKDFQEAVQIGIRDQDECEKTFANCTSNLMTISKRAFMNIVPTDLTKFYKFAGSVKSWFDSDAE